MITIEEILGYTTSKDKASETVTRKYYIRDTSKPPAVPEITPEFAKQKFEAYAKTLPIPENMELGEVSIDEEKSTRNLYYGTISFKKPDGAKVKTKIAEICLKCSARNWSRAVNPQRMNARSVSRRTPPTPP